MKQKDKEIINLLKRTNDTIYGLKQRNEVLAAQVDVFEKCYDMFRSQPPMQIETHSMDICNEIACKVEEMENPNWKPCNVPFDIIKHNIIKHKKQ